MKDSSVAEKIIAGLVTILVAIMGFMLALVVQMTGEFGVFMHHIENHPNVAIESDLDRLERDLRDHEIGHPR